MFLKTKKIKNLTKLLPVLIMPFLMFFTLLFFQSNTQADELDDLIDEYCENVSEEKCEDKKEEIENAEKLAKLKGEQAKTLENQIQILNLEIGSVQGDINSLKNEILTTEEKIEKLLENIDNKTKNIEENQKNLSEMLRGYNKLNKELGLTLISRDNGLGSLFSQSDYLSQLSTKINNILKIVKEERDVLKTEREELEIEKGKLSNQKEELDDQKTSLALKKNERNNILVRTKGEEAEYQALINKIEAQMKQLLIDVGSLSAVEQRELNDILKDAKKPKEGTASTSWHYYQTDSRWKNEKLGGSKYTIGEAGCAISSIAMVFTYYSEKVNPEKLADVSSFTKSGYIDWGSATKKFDMNLIKNSGHLAGSINLKNLESYVDKKKPVILYIRAGNLYGPGHYVVVHGYDTKNKDFVVHDPYWGPNLLLSTSKKLVSSLHKKPVVVDQMIIYEKK